MRLRLHVFVVLAVVPWLSACSGSLCEENGVTVVIEDNHPTGDHKLEVPYDDVAAGEEVVYDITGDNTGHGHTLTVTPDDFSSLEEGDLVTLTSSDVGAAGQDHTHVVLLDCDPDAY